MKNLILYTSRYGSAAEAANRIRGKLAGETDVCNLETQSVPPLAPYGTVILGGSIYIGRVQKALTVYAQSHTQELLGKTLGLYVCAGAPDEKARSSELEGAFSEQLRAHAAAVDVLGYAFTFGKMRFFDRLILSKVKGDKEDACEYFDDRIAAFAEKLQAGTK